VIAQIVRRVRAAVMIVLQAAVVQVRVVHHLVAASVIAIRVQVAHVEMTTVQVAHAVSMTVQRARSQMHSVVPMKFVHAQVAAAMTAMQHRVMIISKSVGAMKVQLVPHVVDQEVVTTMHQSIWSVTRSVPQHQL
jgi:hypothetical protein